MTPQKLRERRTRARSTGTVAAIPRQAVVGLEAEFLLLVDGEERKPEVVFRSPAALLHHHEGRIIPRSGRSCHLPSGGALYFDTGVVEVATALIELEAAHGCQRAVRSLWEQISFVRGQLDEWERASGQGMQLRGFSAHYNFSLFSAVGSSRHLHRLAHLLCFILPIPVMLLAANRRSTAIGARPRPGRIEITADFTPDLPLMNAALAFMAGVISDVSRWPESDLHPRALAAKGLPLLANFRPSKHSSRKGWRAHANDFTTNPFAADPNARTWRLIDGREASLREIADQILGIFQTSVRGLADRATFIHLREVLQGNARSLLDFEQRPPAYDDVGRTIDWGRRRRPLPRSAYERVIQRIIAHRPLRIDGASYQIDRMPGWYEFVFRDVKTGASRTFNLDELARIFAP